MSELQNLESHYENNKAVYEELGPQGAESYMAYYREKFPEKYKRLMVLSNI
tara:strand:- start:10 stop:162 length:153 start_codon:yes stop_codon:yes gene_type:complete